MSHTPGNWIASGANVRDSRGVLVAICQGEPTTAKRWEIASNARLIAAAPELLELAKQYASECGECAGVGVTIEDEDCPECRYVRALIAKAEGA